MEQRIYHAPNITPDNLADFLIQNHMQMRRWIGQKFGSGNSVMVQIGRERHHEIEPAVSVGITRPPDDEGNITVTLGEQQWMNPNMVSHAAMTAAVGVLYTPWALFALLHPARHLLMGEVVPSQFWNTVETYIISQGGTLLQQQNLTHPHAG